MPLDACFLSALTEELKTDIAGMKIDKVQQPERDQLILVLRSRSGARRLLISAGSGDARIHITESLFENPQSPPMFCMLLRKHISGALISSISQPEAERILDIELDTNDEMGVFCKKHLVLELMGNYSNVILTQEDGLIIDCLRRIDGGMTGKRMVLPGLIYRLPPAQQKIPFTGMTQAALLRELEQSGKDAAADKFILSAVSGLSPLIAREIAVRAYGACDVRLADTVDKGGRLIDEALKMKSYLESGLARPYIIFDENGPRDFSFISVVQYGASVTVQKRESFSALLDEFYTKRSTAERIRQRASALIKLAKNHRDRAARKLAVQYEELRTTYNREALREQGDLIMSNLHLMKKGMTLLNAEDYYSPDGGVRQIKLDPLKTPQENAAGYYKAYAKAKTAQSFLTAQIENGEKELEYFESVLEEIALADGEKDLADIRQELVGGGYIKETKNGKKQKQQESRPRRFKSSSGLEILVGRNNAQNDRLTMKTAFKSDIWLHTQKIHGSHVIISANGGAVDEQTLLEAAQLAAFYSQGRGQGKIAVDYTPVKFVKKPSGSKPGMVIYTDYNTLYVSYQEGLVEKLEKLER